MGTDYVNNLDTMNSLNRKSKKGILMIDTVDKKSCIHHNLLSPETALTTAYISALFTILPLGVHNSYYDIRGFKALVFYVLSAIYLTWIGVILPLLRLHRGEKVLGEKLSICDLIFFAFALVGIVSTLLSGFGLEGFLAYNNREQGIMTFLIYSALLFFIRRYGRRTALARWVILIVFSIVSILGILNQFHIDPLGYVSVLQEGQKIRFTSTIGNINFYGAYCVLLFPIPYYYQLHAKNRKETILYSILSMIGLLGTVASRTEGSLLGLLVTVSIMPMLCVGGLALKRFVVSCTLFLLILKAYQYIIVLLGGFRLSALLNIILSPKPYAMMLVLCVLFAFVFRNMNEIQIKRYKQIYRIVFLSLLFLAITGFLLINFFFAKDVPPQLSKYLVITPDWGTDRGRIWSRAIEMLHSFTPRQFLLGGGSGCFARWDMQSRLFSNAVMDTAHNEYLHYMLTHGFLGTAFYIAFIISSIVRGMKGEEEDGRAIACGCIAYACHALVSFAQIFTTPLFFALLFLLPSQSVEQKEKNQDGKIFMCVLVSTVTVMCLLIGWYSTKSCL